MGWRTATLVFALLPACWQSHTNAGPDVLEPDVAADTVVEPDIAEEPLSDPAVEETDPCADGYPPEPYGCTGAIEWDRSWMRATWIEEGGTLANYCLPNQDGEIVCIGDHFCSPDDDFVFIVFNYVT